MKKWYGPFKERPKHYGKTFWAARRSYPEARDELIKLINAKTTSIMVRATALSLLENYPNQKSLPVLQAAHPVFKLKADR